MPLSDKHTSMPRARGKIESCWNTNVFFDTGASGEAFISDSLLRDVERKLGKHITREPSDTRFQPATGPPVKVSTVELTYCLKNVPLRGSFYVVPDLQINGILLGMGWFSRYNAALRVNNRDIHISYEDEDGENHLFETSSFDMQHSLNSLLTQAEAENDQIFVCQHFPSPLEDAFDNRTAGIKPCELTSEQEIKKKELLEEFSDIFQEPSFEELSTTAPTAKIDLLDPSSTPVSVSPYRLGPDQTQAARELIEKLLSKGLIEPSEASWGAPVLVIAKRDADGNHSGWRATVDYRALNALTRKVHYPLPRIEQLLSKLSASKVYSVFDLASGFHQMLLKGEHSKDLSTMNTPFGTFRWRVLPMGISNGPSMFQSFMERQMEEVADLLALYLDDMGLGSDSVDQHFIDLRRFFETCRRNKVRLKLKKSFLFFLQVAFLGHLIAHNYIRILPRNIQNLSTEEPPKTIKQLQSFLGAANYYRQFLPSFSSLAKPLYALLKGKKRKNSRLDWKTDGEILWHANPDGSERHLSPRDAYTKIVELLFTARPLHRFDPHAEIRIFSDASSKVGAGAVLEVKSEGQWHPVEFFSCRWVPAQLNYPIHELELLAIVKALRHFRHFIVGRPFTVLTDNNAVVFYQSKAIELFSPREIRTMNELSEYMPFTMEFVPGHANTVADHLSRFPLQDQNEIRVLDLFAGSHSMITALEVMHSLRPFTKIQYQAIEFEEKHREIIRENLHRAIRRGVPFDGNPFLLGQKMDHDVRLLALNAHDHPEVQAYIKSADLICGGPPCQPFSKANSNKTHGDPRRTCFDWVLTIMKEAEPHTSYAFENVPGILDEQQLVNTLDAKLGPHRVKYLVSAQRRKRVLWSNISMADHSDLIATKTNLPLTWQGALNLVHTSDAEVIAPRQQSPTLMTKVETHNREQAMVLENDEPRDMTISEREALVGFPQGSTTTSQISKKKEEARILRLKLCGNAIPASEYLNWLLNLRPLSKDPAKAEPSDPLSVNGRVKTTTAEDPATAQGTITTFTSAESQHHPLLFHLGDITAAWKQLVRLHKATGHMGEKRLLHAYDAEMNTTPQSRPRIIKMLAKDVLTSCSFCQQNRPEAHPYTPRRHTLPLPLVRLPFAEVVLDEILGLQRSSSGHNAIVVIVCRETGFTIALPIRDTWEAETLARKVWAILNTRGLPSCIWCDNGSRFRGNFTTFFQGTYGIDLRFGPARWHHSQGQVEQTNREIRNILRALLFDAQLPPNQWESWLPEAIQILNDAPKDCFEGLSSSRMAQGCNIKMPPHPRAMQRVDALDKWRANCQQLVFKHWQKKLQAAEAWNAKYNARDKPELPIGTPVLIRNPAIKKGEFASSWLPGYTVLSHDGHQHYNLSSPSSAVIISRHREHIKADTSVDSDDGETTEGNADQHTPSSPLSNADQQHDCMPKDDDCMETLSPPPHTSVPPSHPAMEEEADPRTSASHLVDDPSPTAPPSEESIQAITAATDESIQSVTAATEESQQARPAQAPVSDGNNTTGDIPSPRQTRQRLSLRGTHPAQQGTVRRTSPLDLPLHDQEVLTAPAMAGSSTPRVPSQASPASEHDLHPDDECFRCKHPAPADAPVPVYLCEGCNRVVHATCLGRTLATDQDWFCPLCVAHHYQTVPLLLAPALHKTSTKKQEWHMWVADIQTRHTFWTTFDANHLKALLLDKKFKVGVWNRRPPALHKASTKQLLMYDGVWPTTDNVMALQRENPTDLLMHWQEVLLTPNWGCRVA